MANLTEEFKNLCFKKLPPSDGLFVPLLKWVSGSYTNIENTQRINRRFFKVNQKVLIHELTLTNNVRRFMRYPKTKKKEDKLEFFFNDVCRFFGWTRNELDIHFDLIDWKSMASVISKEFAYEDLEIKALKALKEGNDGKRFRHEGF